MATARYIVPFDEVKYAIDLGTKRHGVHDKMATVPNYYYKNSLSMIEMKTKVTIGLCVKNAAKVVKTAFDSISIQDYPHEFMKLVIVDDGSSDNTLSLGMEFAKETDIPTFVTSSKGKGLGATRQIAVENAEGDYIIWVDDDTMVTKDFIKMHIEFMEKNPNIGAACGKEIPPPCAETVADLLDSISWLLPHRNLKYIGTGGSIFRLEAIVGVGGFDTEIKGAGEDWDISHRIYRSGWLLSINNSAEIRTKGHSSENLRALWKRGSWYGRGNHLLYHKFKDQSLLLGHFPLIDLWGGLKDSCQSYRIIHNKKLFLVPLYSFFISFALNFGFIRAHIDGYGHKECFP